MSLPAGVVSQCPKKSRRASLSLKNHLSWKPRYGKRGESQKRTKGEAWELANREWSAATMASTLQPLTQNYGTDLEVTETQIEWIVSPVKSE